MKVKSAGVVGLSALLLALFGAQPRPQAPSAPATASKSAALTAFVSKQGAQRLVRVDPDTLRVLRGRSLNFGSVALTWAQSPKGTRLAVASEPGAVRIVDLRTLRVLGKVAGWWNEISALAWTSPARIVAVQPQRGRVITIDVPSRRVVKLGSFDGELERFARSADALVFTTSPPNAIGPTTLTVAHGDGTLGSVVLERIWTGSKWPEGTTDTPPIGTLRIAGLAVDRDADRAYVVAAGTSVAEVDLSTLAVTYHDLSRPVSFFGRLRDWVEPQAQAKAANGPIRQARWLGAGLIAVAGSDESGSVDAQGNELFKSSPSGLELIDTRDWSVRTLDEGASAVGYEGQTLLAYGYRWDSSKQSDASGMGLSAYAPDGRRLYHLFGDRRIDWVQAAAGRGCVSLAGFRNAVVDLASGQVLREWTSRNGPPALVTADDG